MVANEDEYILEDFAVRLEHSGFHVRGATCGVTCSAMIESEAPNRLFLDLALLWGGCDGVLAIMSVKERLRSIPIILMESDGIDTHLRRIQTIKVSSILRLPIRTDEMSDRYPSAIYQ